MNESERRNRLPVRRLEPEVQRHQPLAETRGSEFESLPPSHNFLPCVFNDLQHRVFFTVELALLDS